MGEFLRSPRLLKGESMEPKNIFEKPDMVYNGRIYYPKEWKKAFHIIAVLELITLTAFIFLLLTREIEENTTAIIMSMIAVILVSVVCAIGYARFEILVKEDCLFVTPMFGKKRRITFEQITEVRCGWKRKLTLMEGRKRVISVENYAVGYNELYELCRTKNKFK